MLLAHHVQKIVVWVGNGLRVPQLRGLLMQVVDVLNVDHFQAAASLKHGKAADRLNGLHRGRIQAASGIGIVGKPGSFSQEQSHRAETANGRFRTTFLAWPLGRK
jgi:hypothetical protein